MKKSRFTESQIVAVLKGVVRRPGEKEPVADRVRAGMFHRIGFADLPEPASLM